MRRKATEDTGPTTVKRSSTKNLSAEPGPGLYCRAQMPARLSPGRPCSVSDRTPETPQMMVRRSWLLEPIWVVL